MKIKLNFEKMNEVTLVACTEIGFYQRHYHVVDKGDHATLKIFGIDRVPEEKYESVKAAMEAAERIHNEYIENRLNNMDNELSSMM